MVQYCPRCQRANPDKAAFCHFDGCLLRQGAAPVGSAGSLLQEFVFPSGRRCRSYDEIVQGCYAEWDEARQMLADGTFGRYLAAVGRADLAKAAREASSLPDRDMGLTNFIDSLPATAAGGPKLGLSPRRLVLGPVRVGEVKNVQVRLMNEGAGLLQGKVTVGDGSDWLRIGGNESSVAVKTPKEQLVELRADSSRLTVGQNYSGKLVVMTNGGVAEVPVRLDLVVRPFPTAPFMGLTAPRDLAKAMSKNADAAVRMLHSGDIARWFASNGWTYPISGQPAPGKASVQQFFEELGLAKPPPIAITDQEFRFRCNVPESVQGSVTVRTPTRRIVYARAVSDSPWLRVTTPSVAGDFQATIEFAVDSALMNENRIYQGTLKVIANAGQSYNVRIDVDVQGNKSGWFSKKPDPVPAPVKAPAMPVLVPVSPAPVQSAPAAFDWGSVATPAPPVLTPAPAPITSRSTGVIQRDIPPPRYEAHPPRPAGNFVQMVVVGALVGLLGRMALVLPADLFARLLGGEGGSIQAWASAPAADGNFLRLFVLATWWLGAIVGAAWVWRGGGKATDLFCGLVAGAVLGMAGAATLGCVLVFGDGVPRLLLAPLSGQQLGAVVATPLWLFVAIVCWVGIGAGVGGVLGVFGARGAIILAAVASPLAVVCRALGMGRAAAFFALRG